MATTEVPNAVVNSFLSTEAIWWTLRSKKAASPGRFDRELIACWRIGGGELAVAPVEGSVPRSVRPRVDALLACRRRGVAVVPVAAARLLRCRASYAVTAAAISLFSALSASAMSRCERHRCRSFPAESVPPRLPYSRSRRGRPGLGMSPAAGMWPSSERPAANLPPSLGRAPIDEPPS